MSLPYAAIVPVFNPEPGLRPLVESLAGEFAATVVVDDGSVERTDEFRLLPSSVELLRHKTNRGKGRAMKTALRWLAAERPGIKGAVFVDGDGQHRLADVLAVARRSVETDSVVFGVRDFASKDVPFRSWWGNRWTAIEVRLLHGFRLADTQTGLRAVPTRLFDALIGVPGERFEYEAGWFFRLRRLDEPIREIPIETIYADSNRSSHFRPFRDTVLTQLSVLGLAGRWNDNGRRGADLV